MSVPGSEARRPEALRAGIEAVVGDRSLRGEALREALVATVDGWLVERYDAGQPGTALVAVGSLGRCELAPGSDLDLLLLHDGALPPAALAGLADSLWYAVWDAKVSLDHSVRTIAEARQVAKADLRTALGLLDVRHIAGSAELTAGLRAAIFDDWRRQAPRRLSEIRSGRSERERRFGELAFLLEPDLKEAVGGIRDMLALRAAAAGWLVDAPSEQVRSAYRWLLDVRGELQRVSRRRSDRLVMQDQAAVAAALDVDVDGLLRRTSAAGRTIDFALVDALRRITGAGDGSRRWPGRDRRPLRDGVVAAGGEVTLARDADPARPTLALQVAAAAAQANLPIAPATLRRLTSETTELVEPWPEPARQAFVELLSAGAPTLAVTEALDQAGLFSRWLPEWESVRFLPQHNPLHRFTVDRHLIETAVNAAGLSRRVSRPDLLVLAGLFHDIGKGSPGDHSAAGVRLAPAALRRIGLAEPDCETVVSLIRHHLLLPDTATRRDLDDPATVAVVTSAVGDHDRLDLLHALTEADALATGPAAWTEWKAGLVAQLVDRAHAALGGRTLAPPPLLDPHQLAMAAVGRLDLAIDPSPAGARITVVAPDTAGLLWRWAAALALHRLEILTATAAVVPGGDGQTAVTVFDVRPLFGSVPEVALLRAELRRAVDDPAGIEAKLAERRRRQPANPGPSAAPPAVLWSDDASSHATVVEVRAHDSPGLLSRLTKVLAEAGLDIPRARVQTLGAEVVDAFYVVAGPGRPAVDRALRARLTDQLLTACEVPD